MFNKNFFSTGCRSLKVCIFALGVGIVASSSNVHAAGGRFDSTGTLWYGSGLQRANQIPGVANLYHLAAPVCVVESCKFGDSIIPKDHFALLQSDLWTYVPLKAIGRCSGVGASRTCDYKPVTRRRDGWLQPIGNYVPSVIKLFKNEDLCYLKRDGIQLQILAGSCSTTDPRMKVETSLGNNGKIVELPGLIEPDPRALQ